MVQEVELVLLGRLVSDAAALRVVDGEGLEERGREVLLEPVRVVVRDEHLLAAVHDVCLTGAADDADDLVSVLVADGGREGLVCVLADGEGLDVVGGVVS